MRMDVVAGLRKSELAAWARCHLAVGTAVVSDGLGCFPAVAQAGCSHVPIVTGGRAPSLSHPIFEWINTLIGNVKNAMHGTYHALRPKYLQRYLSEVCYRFNRRFDLGVLLPRLLHAAARTPPLPYRLATLDA